MGKFSDLWVCFFQDDCKCNYFFSMKRGYGRVLGVCVKMCGVSGYAFLTWL